jgi:hypothetical protein
MSEYVRTKEDKEKEKSDLIKDKVLIFLRNQDHIKFTPGDILIKLEKDYHGDWKPEPLGYTNKAPKKWLYAFENELGVGYLKQFKADGKLVEVPICMTEFHLDSVKFQIDPDYADHLILGSEGKFNPNDLFKEQKNFRAKAINKNRKLQVPKDQASITAWIDQLKVGDEFHSGYTVPEMTTNRYRVTSIQTKKIGALDQWRKDSLMRDFTLKSTDTIKDLKAEVVRHSYYDKGSKVEMQFEDFMGKCVTQQELFPLTNDI